MEEQTTLKTIAIKDLWDIFVKRVWIMALAAIVAAGSFFAISKATYVPEYSSTATLYILGQNDDSTTSEINTHLAIAAKIVNDCTHMIKSHTVLDPVRAELALNQSYATLKSKISTNNPKDTRILEVTAKAGSPEEAKAIVDAICDKAQTEIERTVGFEQVNIFEYGILNTVPSNATSLTTYILVGIVAAVLVYGVFFLIFMFDDSVWTDEEIDKYLGLSVLGDIPDANTTHRKGYGYYKKYSRYGRYGKYGKYSAYSAYAAYGYNAEAENKTSDPEQNKGGKK